MHGDYESAARSLDVEHSRRADGSRYPPARQQREQHLVGPVLAALRAYPPVVGLVVGSYQGTSASVEALAREAAEARASASWRLMGARSESIALPGTCISGLYGPGRAANPNFESRTACYERRAGTLP